MFGVYGFGQPYFGQAPDTTLPPAVISEIDLTGSYARFIALTGSRQQSVEFTGSSVGSISLTGSRQRSTALTGSDSPTITLTGSVED